VAPPIDAAEVRAALPPDLRARLDACRWTQVSIGRSGAGVWRLDGPEDSDGPTAFVKVARPAGVGAGAAVLLDEVDRLRWFAGRLPVPEVVDVVTDDQGLVVVVTRALPGLPATSDEHRGDVEALIRALAVGLRRVHDLPLDGCPFPSSADHHLAIARERVATGRVDPTHLDAPFRRYTPERLLELVEASRGSAEADPDDLVVVHGDFCLPNVLLDEGAVSGYLDLGRAGVGDRYLDLADVAGSLARNLSPEALGPFFDAYGLDLPDLLRIDFYVLLGELL
jgi:kanamycin kinase/aminoglycoside 3'-phosphotransferase-2